MSDSSGFCAGVTSSSAPRYPAAGFQHEATELIRYDPAGVVDRFTSNMSHIFQCIKRNLLWWMNLGLTGSVRKEKKSVEEVTEINFFPEVRILYYQYRKYYENLQKEFVN